MGEKYGPETSHEERDLQRMQIVYSGKMRERQVFMEELKAYRKKIHKCVLKKMHRSIGPTWYHALSVPQRESLDTLEFSIYQDLLEGRPIRSAKVMARLGLCPRPNSVDLMNCLYLGRDDPKVMLAELFAIMYGHTIDGKRAHYDLNAKLILSAILYLGLNNLIELLKERFSPDQPEKPPPPKPKPKPEPPLKSPYLQKMIAVLYEPPRPKPSKPAPLPNLEALNEPLEDPPPIPKPPPPPPPPPPPKKRIPISYCQKLAGILTIEPYPTDISVKAVERSSQRRVKGDKVTVTEVKKTYGICVTRRKKSTRKRRLKAPKTGLMNAQYVINGVYTIQGKTVFVLGCVTILPPMGDLIHGGYRYLDGEYINIHCGFRALPPPPKPDPCDCVKQWQSKVLEYVKSSKCYCKHFYDFGHEDSFPPEELPFFQKPTKHQPCKFNYDNIYNIDPKSLHVDKEFKTIWDTDSMLRVDDGTTLKKDKKKKKRDSATCLGDKPKAEDYLRCALKFMRQVNVAARLPDAHQVPELKEWMRRRIHGPFKTHQKNEFLRKSTMYWQMLTTMAMQGFGHVSPFKDPTYGGHTTWVHKQNLNDKFRKFTYQYRLELFRSLARINNLMWATMFQAEFPDKKFREIYFSYLFGRVEDLSLMHPYNITETTERKLTMARRRYCCIPDGIEPPE